jgi:hypothetical protein
VSQAKDQAVCSDYCFVRAGAIRHAVYGSIYGVVEAAQLARDPFQQGPPQLVGSPFPQALRSQFSGSLGGPILKDKAFSLWIIKGSGKRSAYRTCKPFRPQI